MPSPKAGSRERVTGGCGRRRRHAVQRLRASCSLSTGARKPLKDIHRAEAGNKEHPMHPVRE